MSIGQNLIDQYGRKVRKLRLSLIDNCNFRCHYCMPIDSTFMKQDKYLSIDEITTIASELKEYGVEEIRLTGGEPLLRREFKEIARSLAKLNFRKLALTTNGALLERYFNLLKESNIFSLNISLDSLKRDRFEKITYSKHFDKTIENIISASRQGFDVKLNVVAMKGVNDDEILDFMEFSKQHKVEVRFLELMKIGHACGEQNMQFMSADEIQSRIETKYKLKRIQQEADSTSYNFITDCGAQVGFIASETKPFCGDCSRWRLTADGQLKACLFKEDGLSLKGLSHQQRANAYQSVLGMKDLLRSKSVSHQMNLIGG